MLTIHLDTVRLFLHVLAATVWVGGQITLGALVPALRGFGSDVTRAAARRFAAIGWTAFAVLIATGVWNVIAVRDDDHGRYQTTLMIKMAVVVVSGVAAFVHQRAKAVGMIAATGAIAALSALLALFLGVLLAG